MVMSVNSGTCLLHSFQVVKIPACRPIRPGFIIER